MVVSGSLLIPDDDLAVNPGITFQIQRMLHNNPRTLRSSFELSRKSVRIIFFFSFFSTFFLSFSLQLSHIFILNKFSGLSRRRTVSLVLQLELQYRTIVEIDDTVVWWMNERMQKITRLQAYSWKFHPLWSSISQCNFQWHRLQDSYIIHRVPSRVIFAVSYNFLHITSKIFLVDDSGLRGIFSGCFDPFIKIQSLRRIEYSFQTKKKQ